MKVVLSSTFMHVCYVFIRSERSIEMLSLATERLRRSSWVKEAERSKKYSKCNMIQYDIIMWNTAKNNR